MVVYVFKDTFNVQSIEAVCVSQDLSHGLEINTISGGTYKYSFRDDASRDEVLSRLRSAVTMVNDCKCMDATKTIQTSLEDSLNPKSIEELLNR